MKVIKALGMRLHPSAKCEDCAWSHPTSGGSRERAKDHVKASGHRVLVETLTVDAYRPATEEAERDSG